MANKDTTWNIVFDKFYQGFSPAFWKNSLSTIGNSGHANAMTDIDILDPNVLTQGPGLTALTAGTQAGAVTDLVKYILDKAVTDDKTYAISSTKLHELSATAVTNTGNFPHTITDATDGQSVALLKGNLYYLYNKSTGGDIGKYDLSTTFTDAWGSSTPTGASALQSAPHPVATKEDIMLFGNGRYVGVFINDTNTLTADKLDFGQKSEVADVVFTNNNWLIAVNSPNLSGSNRSEGNIFLYDGSATTSILDDEVGAGLQRIGFLQVIGGLVYLAYQDLTSTGGFKIGYIAGKRIIPLGAFTGSLPLFYQKTLFENTILFLSGQKILSNGAVTDDFPIQTSNLTSARYATSGAISAPFGTVLVASTASTNYSLDKFDNYSVTGSWTSLVHPVSQGRFLSHIKEIIVWTDAFESGGRVDVTLQYDHNASNSGAKEISTASTRRHVIPINKTNAEDFRIVLDYSNGSTTIPVKIRKIEASGSFNEK